MIACMFYNYARFNNNNKKLGKSIYMNIEGLKYKKYENT